MQDALRTSLAREGKDAVFAGLSLDKYLALSEEEDNALWDRLFKEAEQELKIPEQDIPGDFVPAKPTCLQSSALAALSATREASGDSFILNACISVTCVGY